MTDLQKEIAKLEHLNYREKFAAIIKIAYQRNELLNLLSGDTSYIYDISGHLWLKPQEDCEWNSEPFVGDMDINTLAIMLNDVYKELSDPNLKATLEDALTTMLSGTPLQFYYAMCIYCQLASLETNQSSGFARYYIHKYSFAQDFHTVVLEMVKSRKCELLNTYIKDIGFQPNLYKWCESKSNTLVKDGFAPILEV